MSWVIHIARSCRPDAWHTGWRETEVEAEAQAFGTREQAQRHLDLCGLYPLMGWTATVRKSKCSPNVPGPGSTFSYVSGPMPAKMRTANGGFKGD